jgi:hypothetical protein
MIEAGWYPDPGSSTAERYWDGSKWTTHLRPATVVGSSVSGTDRRRRLIVGLSAAVVVVVVMLIVGIALLVRDDDASTASNAGAGHPDTVLSGSSDQWLASVCAPGRFADQPVTSADMLSYSLCLSARDQSPMSVMSFSSQFAADNAAEMYTKNGGQYASGVDKGGTVWIFTASWQDKANSLNPLQEFGFTIHPRRPMR